MFRKSHCLVPLEAPEALPKRRRAMANCEAIPAAHAETGNAGSKIMGIRSWSPFHVQECMRTAT